MPGTNQFLPFAVGAGANTLTPAAYAALTSLLSGGFASGVANSAQFNTALRQATTAAAGLSKFIADQGPNVNDDGSPTNYAAGLLAALQAMFVDVSSFTGGSQSLGASGFQKLPGGLILQWGYVATTNVTGAFPVAFPAQCFCVLATNTDAQGGGIDNAFGYPVSRTQFFVATKQQGPSGGLTGYPVFWLAIGV